MFDDFWDTAKNMTTIKDKAIKGIVTGVIGVSSIMMLGTNEAQAKPLKWAEGQILVQPRSGLSDEKFATILKRHGGRSKAKFKQINVHVVNVPPQAEDAVARALAKNPNVAFAEKDMLLELSAVIPNDPKYSSGWHLPKIDATNAWDNATGQGITVAILDTGVDATHPDLEAQMVAGWNSSSNNSNTSDVNGHGTKVAGTTAAITNNSLGVASIAWNARIMPLRVTDSSDGYAYWSSIASALTWAADHGADVANISYDATGSSTINNAASYFKNKGGVTVVAAGNSGANPGHSDSPYMISVSATTSSDVRASWSSFGNYVDVSAPGAGIWTTTRGGGYGSVSGTSFASPATAGVVALIKSANPLLKPDEVEQILESTSVDLGSAGWDSYYGHGRVNASAAVLAALNYQAQDTTAPNVTITSPTADVVADVVGVNVSASDNVGVERVDLFADGVFIGSDSTSPFAFSWNTNSASEGPVSLVAYAYDASANEGRSNSVVVSVDNIPDPVDDIAPSVAITNPADGSTLSRTVDIRVSANDNVAVTKLSLYIDGSLKSVSNANALAYSWNTRKAASGAHTIAVKAEDAAGNSTSHNITATIGSGSTRKKGRRK